MSCGKVPIWMNNREVIIKRGYGKVICIYI